MAEFLTTASQLMCPHGGTVSASSQNSQTRAGGAPIVRQSDTFTVAGCPFNISGSPHPCVRVQWSSAAARNSVVSGQALTRDCVGLCLAGDNAPQGTVMVVSTQPRAKGT